MATGFWTGFFDLSSGVRLIVYSFLLILLVVSSEFFLLGPAREELGTLSSRTDEIRVLLEKKKKLQTAIRSEREEIRKIEGELSGAQEKLPNQKEIPVLLRRASSLGREAGLNVTLFRQKPEIFRDFYMEVPVEMSARGGYHQVRRYFQSLAIMPRIVTVTNLLISNPKVDTSGVSLQASFLLTTYRFLNEAERATIRKAQAKS